MHAGESAYAATGGKGMRLTALLVPLVLALALAAERAEAALRLTDGGEPVAAIVISDRASETERFAAEELRDYIERISGARLTVQVSEAPDGVPRIFVGRTGMSREEFERLGPTEQADAEGAGTTAHLQQELTEHDEDAFIVRRDWDDLFLVGASDRATLYAVYDFLERELGCRFLGPAPLWEEVPERATIEVGDVDRLEAPALTYRFTRETGGRYREPGTLHANNGRWAVQRKMNVGREWPGKSRHREVDSEPAVPVNMRAWIRPHTTGVELLPADEHFDDNPEWYAKMPEGARYNWQGTGRSRGHLCLSHPEVIERVADDLVAMFDEQPHKQMLMIGSDGGDTWCQCEDCMAMDPEPGRLWFWSRPDYTARWLTFLNAVADRVAEHHPEKKLLTLSYRPNMAAPRPDEVQPHPNLVVQIATWSPLGCRLHRIEDEQCMPHADLRDVYEQWRASGPAGMMLYEYIGRASMRQMPYPVPRRLAADIRYLHERGLIGYEGQTHSSRQATYMISKYIVGKAMWDPNLDVDAAIADFCDHAFHEASEPMQRFYATLEEGIDAGTCSWDAIWHALTPEVLEAARAHLDEAHERASASSEIVRQRLRTHEIDLRCAELAVAGFRMQAEARTIEDPELLAAAIDKVRQAVDYVRAASQEDGPHHGVHTVSTLNRWVRSQERALERMDTGDDEPEVDEAEPG